MQVLVFYLMKYTLTIFVVLCLLAGLLNSVCRVAMLRVYARQGRTVEELIQRRALVRQTHYEEW